MRGEVLHFDAEHGFGFITGSDGKRYTFEKTDLRREFAVAKGTLVEFQPEVDKARDIFLIRGEAASTAGDGFGRFAVAAEPEPTGLFSYFMRCLTSYYTNFQGRARRKEYWGFVLFWWILAVIVTLAGAAVDQALGNFDPGTELPVVTMGLTALLFLATLLPGLALSVRRQHDIGLSGWFYLLFFIPYVGGLIIFVFSLIPSQRHANKWGAVPYGVRV